MSSNLKVLFQFIQTQIVDLVSLLKCHTGSLDHPLGHLLSKLLLCLLCYGYEVSMT